MHPRRLAITAALLGLGCSASFGQTTASSAGLQPGDLLGICGDSITEQHIYSVDIETYLIACRPVAGVRAEQFGWSGETAQGFASKMSWFTLPFAPTAVTTCYGMNDGHYAAMSDATGNVYRRNETTMIDRFKRAGVRYIVLGSPGAVDTYTYDRAHTDRPKAAVYNKTLAALTDIDRELAQQQGLAFADVHGLMLDVMAKAKAKYGDAYAVAGPDGVHPGANGHLVMAYAYLKAMNLSGDTGTVTLDLAAHKADATDGHKVLAVDGDTIQMESTRYPFCFSGDPKSPDATTGIIEFLPFNEDLNRFKLVVTHPGAERLKVTFGATTKEFAAADLAKGINLAAEFMNNPFGKPFNALLEKVRAKQGFESTLDKQIQSGIAVDKRTIPEASAAYEDLSKSIRGVFDAQSHAVADSVAPVRYSIRVEAVK